MKRHIRKLQTHGTSIVVAIPKEIREVGGFKKGAHVELKYVDGRLVITHFPDHYVNKCYKCNGTGILLVKKKSKR